MKLFKFSEGLCGENEPGYIDYMAEKPFQYAYGQELYPGIFMKAACYLEGFATHQYFSDGNKRTGVMCYITFYLLMVMKLMQMIVFRK